ncbi:MAG: sensor histidine kinase, partial [Actinomycetes bacterium]
SLAMCAVLGWRRQAPLTAAVGAGALFAAYPAIDGSLPESLVQAVALLVGAYAVAAFAALRPALTGLGIVVAAGAVRSALMDYDAGSVVVNSLWAAVAWGLGRAMRERDRRVAMAELAAAETERLRDATEREATLAERRRIARELHDVVAHAVTVIVVQARGARRWIETDPQGVRGALDAIEEMGSEAIDELRRMLALLDDPDEGEVPDAVRSGPAELGALVERVRAAGLPVSLEVTG